MLSILILSHQGEGKELAYKLNNEGNIVKLWSENPEAGVKPAQNVYPWQEIDQYQKHLETADLVIFTSSRPRGLAEELRRRGKMVVGGTIQGLLVDEPEVREAALRLLQLPNVLPSSGWPVSLCGWYDGSRWVCFLSHRYDRLLDGERGPKMGLGCLVYPEESRLTQLTPMLSTAMYRGFISLDVVMTADDLYFEKFNPYPSLEMMAVCEAMQTQLGTLLYNVAANRLHFDRTPQYGLCMKLVGFNNKAVFDPPTPALKHCWKTFDDYYLGCITAGGITVTEARRRAYRTVSNSTNLDTIYRRDIGCNSVFEQE